MQTATTRPPRTGDPRAGGVPAPALHQLAARNLARLQRVYPDGLAGIETTSAGDKARRAYLIERLAEVDAAIGDPGPGAAA